MAELAGDSGAGHSTTPRPVDWRRWPDCAVRGIDTMVCSGGVLHNRLLAARLTFIWRILLCCLQQLPAGDGAIAYGQAVIAAARGQAQGIQP